MLIPATVEELEEAHALFGHAPCEQAVPGKASGLFHGRAIEILHVLGLLGNIHEVRDLSLHPEGHLILFNPGLGLGVGEFLESPVVELLETVKQLAACFPAVSYTHLTLPTIYSV